MVNSNKNLNGNRNGSDTRGYFTWSFLDVFELMGGYEAGYGLYYVDFFDPDLKRYPKLSAKWYSDFLRGETVGPDPELEQEQGRNIIGFTESNSVSYSFH